MGPHLSTGRGASFKLREQVVGGLGGAGEGAGEDFGVGDDGALFAGDRRRGPSCSQIVQILGADLGFQRTRFAVG